MAALLNACDFPHLIFLTDDSQINERSAACPRPSRGAFRTPYFLLMKSFIFVLRSFVRDVTDDRSDGGSAEFALSF
jgi:hypothetical protein